MILHVHANHKGWPLSHIEVGARTRRATDGAPKDVFDREIRLKRELSAEERSQRLAIAVRCPVSRTLVAGVAVQTRFHEIAPVGDQAVS